MKLKIFIPDIKKKMIRKTCTPFLYPFIEAELTDEERVEKYGNWITMINIVDSIENCDIVAPAYHLNYYYAHKKTNDLFMMNNAAAHAFKLTVCWTIGDWGITPPLKNFHLYRFSGYQSRNKGNEFCMPFFLGIDPVEKHYNGS